MPVTEANGINRKEDDVIEIRLSDIVQFFKDSRWIIIFWSCVFFIIGILYAFSKPNLYTAQVTVMPEIQSKAGGLGGLGSLAGLAGIDIGGVVGGSTDAIRPDLYPEVLKSVPFALDILQQTVYSQKLEAKITMAEFIRRMNDANFLNIVINLLSNKDTTAKQEEKADPKNFSKAIQVTKEQDILIRGIHETISANYDKKTGIITIITIELDPVVAATVARLSLEYLTNYITNYRTEKARKQVSFLMQQVSEAKVKYQLSEYALSTYRDRNRNLFLETAKIGEQRLQADYLLAQTVYNELSKQLEQAKIKVQEETPVFKILEPPTVPLRKSSPKRTLIIIGFAIAGAFFSIAVLLAQLILRRQLTITK